MKLTSKTFVIAYAAVMAVALLFAVTGNSEPGMPDFTKAFSDAELVERAETDTMDTYAYMSEASLDDLKAEFADFLGSGWTSSELDAATLQDLASTLDEASLDNLRGVTLYHHPAFPDRQIALSRMRIPLAGDKHLVNISVMKAAESH